MTSAGGPGLELRVIQGPDIGRTVPLNRTVTVGRDPAAELVLSDDQTSRRHATITPDNEGATVTDLGSTNGTFLNGTIVTEPRRLRPLDRIELGETVLEY